MSQDALGADADEKGASSVQLSEYDKFRAEILQRLTSQNQAFTRSGTRALQNAN